jgi:hypothetical protein
MEMNIPVAQNVGNGLGALEIFSSLGVWISITSFALCFYANA